MSFDNKNRCSAWDTCLFIRRFRLGGRNDTYVTGHRPATFILLLHVPMVLLQTTNLESSEVVLVPCERRQGSLG